MYLWRMKAIFLLLLLKNMEYFMNLCVILENMLFLKVLNTHLKRLTEIFLCRLCKISTSDCHGFEG